ncbi:MAG TPA: zf-TFIIB domain-containing protein [Acidimicrobiales bacterium]|nr:zf-TFIIB domain-containing protein [Acidimicrobiales bacterium]
MKCPADGATLEMSERQGVEIDYCPDCRGVWLDRGELDKILDRAESVAASPPPPPSRRTDDREYDDRRPHKKKKRTSFLSELFED